MVTVMEGNCGQSKGCNQQEMMLGEEGKKQAARDQASSAARKSNKSWPAPGNCDRSRAPQFLQCLQQWVAVASAVGCSRNRALLCHCIG